MERLAEEQQLKDEMSKKAALQLQEGSSASWFSRLSTWLRGAMDKRQDAVEAAHPLGNCQKVGNTSKLSDSRGRMVDEASFLSDILINKSFDCALPSIPVGAAVVDLDHNMLTSFPADVCNGSSLPGAYKNPHGCDQVCVARVDTIC